MKYCKGMSIKREHDVHENNNASTNQEESKAISYFKTLMSSAQTSQKKEKSDKHEPTRFLGDGVSFKAKLIGILEVSEARGDRMCQEALSDLKMAIRAAGEHKQRININIAIDGLRLRDEKTGDCLYHHPVHRISFIAQDMSDSRAFGYIFGSPDTGHRFFGIKTDKAASQVVITMRDLFQVVFELKKKEIEMAKQHIEQHQIKYSSSLFPDSSSKTSVETLKVRTNEDHGKSTASSIDRRDNQEHIMDLLDLELELNNIQQGINQMERITPSDPFGPTVFVKSAVDPFGDSFNPLQSRTKIPPPPESSKKPKPNDRHWFDQENEALFEETELPSNLPSHQVTSQTTFPISTVSVSPLPTEMAADEPIAKKSDSSSLLREQFDVFTDLDPLGTGRSKPYIDKKDFFQDLKNPPKKVLKDLVTELPLDCKQTHDQDTEYDNVSSQPNVKNEQKKNVKPSIPVFYSDPFQTDPFDKDPFSDVDFSRTVFTPGTTADPFEKFADFASFDMIKKEEVSSSDTNKKMDDESKSTPLKVSLPPEKLGNAESVPLSPHMSRKANRLQKNNTISCIIKPPSPVPKRGKLVSQPSLDQFERNSPIMEGVTIRNRTSNVYASIPSCNFSEGSAPEPPPRSALNSLAMKPPPLPPKRLTFSASAKPPPRPPQSDYDYIENYHTTTYTDVNSPPLPAPARKLKTAQKPSLEPEYYLQPFPLLPPPKKKTLSPKATSINDSQVQSKEYSPAKSSLDITLSQLTKTGFSDLASTLNMSPTSLSKMTLQDLTKRLASLSMDSQSKEVLPGNPTTDEKNIKSTILKTECYSALRESIEDDNVSFTAEFESHFNTNTDFETKTEESLFDKYAVFRELLEEEKKHSQSFPEETESTIESQNPSSFEEVSENVRRDNSVESQSKAEDNPVEDRYAALREICIDEAVEEKYDPDLSDKEDSVIEPSRLEEDTDLLPQSHPLSESTESPTITMKEHQSIIEATIMEEDISALEVDEEVLEESVDETIKEPLPKNSDNVDLIVGSSEGSKEKDDFSAMVQSINMEIKQLNDPSKNDTSSWAKFDTDVGTGVESRLSTHSEGHVSPWSAESKDNDLSPACRDKRKHKKVRRHKQNVWHEDEESEEGWDMRMDRSTWSPSRRENGWSDVDSLYDEAPPYVEREYHSPRKSRRRRASPWSSRDQSPWEEDDREICEEQWENPRWQDEHRQRPKHRGPSWEDERRRHYEDPRKSRKPMMWSSDLDRKSSRESLTWEEDERYAKRNYGERRRRKWDDDFHNRNRWRERAWTDSGMKTSNRYYKDRNHDPHYEVEYSDHADDESDRWQQRPRSCERGRRQFSVHHSADADFPERTLDRRYTRSREGHCADDYKRRAHTLQSQKQRRKHSQTSPFEDDFASQFGFSKDISSPMGSDVFESDAKHSSTPFESGVKAFSEPCKQDPPEYNQSSGQGNYSRESSKVGRGYQQSPFEDDFTPPEARRCSGRSASSELSDQRGSDDVFFSNVNESSKSQRSDIARRPKSATHAETLSRKKINKTHGDHPNVGDPSRDYPQSESDQVDINNAQHINERKQANIDFKLQGSVKRSDSSNSLRKSESVNIFARNNDPFDDDFFCEESTKVNRNKEKLSKNIISDTKWNESFDTFSFDDK